MRILHITAVRTGSTGRTATDLKSLLSSYGHQYKIAFSKIDNKPIDGDILIGNWLDHKIHAILSRLLGLQGYFSYFATKKLLRKIRLFKPDLVQLGNLHANFINLPLLFDFLAKEQIPVVMVLHDCWLFTGHCTHFTAIKCEKWKIGCELCQALNTGNPSWFFDRSAKVFNDRKRWYKSLSTLSVIAVSDWEKHLAEQSPLFSYAEVIRVYNWIDTDVFKPATLEQQNDVKKKYNLFSDKKYVIAVSADWSPKSSKTRDAISVSLMLPSEYRLIVVGHGRDGLFPDNVIRIPYTSSPSELAALYSISDAYLHFSIEDTFGKVIAEAMSCGTVPIVYDSTACGETASPYGIAVSPHDINAMINAISIAQSPDRSKKVREYALNNYSVPDNMNKYWYIKELTRN